MASPAETSGKVLVTGANGYIAGHVIIQLLKRGYSIRGTVRDLSNTKKYQYITDLKEQYPQYSDKIELVEANLLNEECWQSVVSGCDKVMHVASPVIFQSPKDENELIKPAVEGTLNVLRACSENGVKKVVLTSSIASIITGHTESKTYDETEWANTDVKGINVYMKSKPLAEKAAWKFVEDLPADKKFELTTILPSAVVGPPLTVLDFASSMLVAKLLNGEVPAQPRLSFDYVDVRDVAKAHILALESDKSAGQRYICTAGMRTMKQMATTLANEFNKYGYGVKPRNLPNWLVGFVSLFDKEVREIKPLVGKEMQLSNDKIRRDLGIDFLPLEPSMICMAYDLIVIGLIKKDRTKGVAQEKKTTLKTVVEGNN
eukprot:CAMPEP_0115007972 /NCGR_PEP_ID=MMETSP0216-20121206/21591_1 /TAXON_ID=223996 /ORGANISM="Protocruzia adherens, Strain Boccale" /LENGTH=373 /DNA_ID=CAMNT_0002375203 /DNA_START=54 /DNA_END=1173 /DNA_ORIENTATION=+